MYIDACVCICIYREQRIKLHEDAALLYDSVRQDASVRCLSALRSSVWKSELTQGGAPLSLSQLNKGQARLFYHIHCMRNHSVQGVPVASGSWNNTKNFIIIHWFSFQHTISFESNGSIKSYLWGQPRYRQMLTCYWWQGGKKLLNTADQYLVSLLQPSADIKYISLQLQK